MEQTDIQPSSSRSLKRLLSLELSPAQFLIVALGQLAALWLIVGTGAAVRLTDSGLGCRHWPGCEEGHPLPAKDYHSFIEFGNRVMGGVTILLTLLVALAARRTPGLPRWTVRLAGAVFVGTLLQAPLGLLAVASDLEWPIVMAHLLLSIVLLGGAVVVVLEAYGLLRGHSPPVVPAELRMLGLILAAACFGAVFGGSFATAGGPHSGGGDVSDVDRLWRLEPLVYIHAVGVGVFIVGLVLVIGYLAANRAQASQLLGASLVVAGLLLLQVAVGETQYWTHLPWWLVLVHVVLASAVWSATVGLVYLFFRPPSTLVPSRAYTDRNG
jgi:heme a synthase